jgi:hypothetical protein
MPHNPTGLHSLLQEQLYLFSTGDKFISPLYKTIHSSCLYLLIFKKRSLFLLYILKLYIVFYIMDR